MKIWTPKKPPCNPRKKHLQTLSDAKAWRNRFRINPLAKLASGLFVPQPLRFAPGYPCCCDTGPPITPSQCPDCVDGGPLWWEVTDSSGRKFYVTDDSEDCTWSPDCFVGSFEVKTTAADKLQVSGPGGTNLTDVLPVNGSGQIIKCNKTHTLTTGAGPWVTLTPLSSAHDLWGLITPPASLVITLSGFSNGAGDCTSCDNANAAWEVIENGLTLCKDTFTQTGSACNDNNKVCTGVGAVRHVISKVAFKQSTGPDYKIFARVTISYYSPTGEGCQVTTTVKFTDKMFDNYSLNSSLFPFSVQIAHPFGGSSFQCTGTITATVDF